MTADNNKKLGTFLGVYTPTILTILGVIMYMRAGWIIGNVGLRNMLFIVLLSNSITLITTLSFSSIATNKKVGAGGAYYIVSRSLGFSIGGAVGLPLFLSQAFSITLYAFGLAEVLAGFVPGLSIPLTTFGIIVIVAAVSIVGAGFAMKTQIPVMVLVAVSILFLAIGAGINFFGSDGAMMPMTFPEPAGKPGFFQALAIFFPAVTGIMAGLGLSGDLEDPKRSIPRGSIGAVLTGFAIYLSLPVLLVMGSGGSQDMLLNDRMIWSTISPLGKWVIIPGLVGAIFSSAVGSMLGAPRTLAAMVNDHVRSQKLIEFVNSRKGMFAAFGVSLAVAFSAIFLGDLNTVATIASMFFLTIYAIVNVTSALENIIHETSWRPSFQIPWILSMIGAVCCVIVMFLIDKKYCVICIFLELIFYFILQRRTVQATSGDARRGVYEFLVKTSLSNLRSLKMTPRNWRPYIQLIVNDHKKQLNLVRFASYFGQNSGIVTVSELIFGDLNGTTNFDRDANTAAIDKFYSDANLVVFPESYIVENHLFESSLLTAVQANGMAGLRSNLVMMCWPDKPEYLSRFLVLLRKFAAIKLSAMIGRVDPDFEQPRDGSRHLIHVWWGGLQRNGDLMLLLAYLLKCSHPWKNSVIRLISVVPREEDAESARQAINRLSVDSRIAVEPEVIVRKQGEAFPDILDRTSAEADVVFLGLKTPSDGEEADYAEQLRRFAKNLKTVFFIKNSSVFQGQLLETSSEGEQETK